MYDTDAFLRARAEQVVEYTLSARLDERAHTVHGEGTLKWRNTSRVRVRELYVHLYMNAFKNDRSAFGRRAAGGFRGAPLTEWGSIDVRKLSWKEAPSGKSDLLSSMELRRPGDDDETDARVPLPREVEPGEQITLEFLWDVQLPSVVMRAGFADSFHMVAQWYPKIARLEPDGRWAHFPYERFGEFYSDFGTFDVSLDVPDHFVIGATGPLVEKRTAGGRRVERHMQADVHDFAWSAWDKFQQLGDTIDGVQVSILYPPGHRVVALRQLTAIRHALPLFRSRFGRYPYATLTVVHPPAAAREAGGMEYPTLITTGGPWYGPPGALEPELVAVHELAHQWFYGLVATDEVSLPMLDEGLTTFAEMYALSSAHGAGSAFRLAGLSVSDATIRALSGRWAAHDQQVAQPVSAFETGALYSSLVYGRTASLLETVRRVYGDDALFSSLGRYARRYRYMHPTSEELLGSFEEVMGKRVRETVRTALFDRGWVDYAVVALESSPAHAPRGLFDQAGERVRVDGRNLTGGFVGAAVISRRGSLRFPVDVELHFADGSRQRVRWDGEEPVTRIPFEGPSALRGVVVDPEEAILLDGDRTNNFALAPGASGAGAPRTAERLLYWAQLLLQWLSP
jgi:hypothetical protein